QYALSAIITLDKDGNRLGTRIFKSVINSKIRGVYSEVNDIFEKGEDSEFFEKYSEAYPALCDMRSLYEILRKKAEGRGVLELEDTEAVIILDENGEPVDVVRRERGDGERLIEQFMLQANMGVAETLKSHSLPCLYRIHEKPDGDKIRSFAVFAHNLGLSTRGIVNSEMAMVDLSPSLLSEKLMQILSDANEKGIGPMVSTMLLRSMMKAKYQSVCSMHFGLGAETYCHFTSPIRRYPDLFVHTVITQYFEKYGGSELSSSSSVPDNALANLSKIAYDRGVSSSEAEITAQTAEREIEDLYMTLFMSKKIGETFHVTVSSVIRSGMFVQCENLVEGFVPASFYPGAKINEDFMTLTSGGKVYTLGSELDVCLIEADVSTGKITFQPTDKR
ncbi:MAG: RNB domain-containing ribonuclease, partial [Ruminococcaceae bacterium]|nr:RNB domain-containing ribonuclease [Oscillospiraceae bacterium]